MLENFSSMHCSQYYNPTVHKEGAGSGCFQLAEMCDMGETRALSVKILLVYLKTLCSECFLADSIHVLILQFY